MDKEKVLSGDFDAKSQIVLEPSTLATMPYNMRFWSLEMSFKTVYHSSCPLSSSIPPTNTSGIMQVM